MRSTIDGVDVILTTARGEQLQGITSTEGNNLIIDIPNARLDLPEEDKSRENPVNGIASVTVTTVDVANIQVIIAGTTGTPVGEAITTSQGIYDFNPNLMVYGSIARGYNPAGVNYEATVEEVLRYDTETSTNYEIGLKSSWFSDRLSLNVAGFINDVSDFQVSLTGDTGFFEDITNAEVVIRGFEIEVRAVPVTGLDLIAGFGYTDAEYTDYVNPFTGEDFEGNRLIYAPEFTYNLAIQYRAQFGLFSRVELQGLGNYFFDDENSLKQESLALVNTRIGYEADKYGIYFYVNNLFDEEYLTAAFGSAGTTLASYGDRRTFGFQVKSEF